MSNLVVRDKVQYTTSINIYKTLEDRLYIYLNKFWEAHSLPENWLAQDTSNWPYENNPICHGLVLVDNHESLKSIKSNFEKFLQDRFGSVQRTYVDKNALHNRAIHFMFIDLSSETSLLKDILRGRIFDIILLFDIIATDDMVKQLTSIIKDDDTQRILNITTSKNNDKNI